MESNLQLYGFNNLTKTLSFNIYDVCYAETEEEKREYIEYIHGQYNSERLTGILRNLTDIIGAHILNLSKQDYTPQGASVSILIAEAPLKDHEIDPTNNRGVLEVPDTASQANCEALGKASQASCEASGKASQANCEASGKASQANCEAPGKASQANCEAPGKVSQANCEASGKASQANCEASGKANQAICEVGEKANLSKLETPATAIQAHLNTSHVSVHTFPESHPSRSISTFRVDIDVSTCGRVTPLVALDYLIGNFESDIITIDYRVRGFTRNTVGTKLFNDYPVRSIQDFISVETLDDYNTMDVNVYHSNLYHTRMILREIDLDRYIFNRDVHEIGESEQAEIRQALEREMLEIYNGRNIFEDC